MVEFGTKHTCEFTTQFLRRTVALPTKIVFLQESNRKRNHSCEESLSLNHHISKRKTHYSEKHERFQLEFRNFL